LKIRRSKKFKLKKILKKSFDIYGDLIFLLTKEGTFLDFIGNQKYLAARPEEFLGKTVDEVFPKDLAKKLMRTIKRVFKTKTIAKEEVTLKVRGELKYFEQTYVLYNNETIIVFARDRTDVKHIESEREVQKKNLEKVLDTLEDGVYIVDQNYDLFYCNPIIEKAFGKNTNKKCYDYFLDRTSPCTHCYFPKIKSGESVKRTYYNVKNKKTYDILSTPFRDVHGNILKLSILRDISEEEKAKQRLQQSEETYRSLSKELELIFNHIPEPIYYKDTENNFIKVNDYYAKLVGYRKNELENKNAFNIYPKNRAQRYWEHDLEVMINKQPKLDIEEEWDTNLGKRWVLTSRIPIIDGEGKVSGILGIAKDITERKRAQQKLKESEDLFRRIAEQSILGILIIQDNEIKYLNNTICDISGYTEEEIRDWTFEQLQNVIHRDDRAMVFDQLSKKQKGETDVKTNYKFRLIAKDGSILWVDNYSKPIMYNGKLADFITFVDITESIKVQQELIKLNQLRSELLSRTSHELKTPLTVIKGYTELLKTMERLNLNREALQMVEMINNGINSLQDLIEKILNASKVKSKKLEIQKKSHNLSDLIHASVKEMEGLLQLRNHFLELNIHEELITKFDWNALLQVLKNIISNAIKFTPPNGKIELTTQKTDKEIIIRVKDNGIGFEPQEKEFLFSEFGKVERFGKDFDIIPGGSGLGLYISKYIIELHGGRIWMESEGRDKGSIFYFSLPLSMA
jgi:PAS domain S-box-containing protein